MAPLISIIMAVFNAERYVEETIYSILKQYETDFELIIIDDCPTDNTMKIVETIQDDRIRIIHHEKNMGVSYTRNQGIDEAKGKYIVFMDHDDLLPKTRLKNHVSFLEEHPTIDALGGINIAIDSDDNFNHIVYETTPTDSKYIRAYLLNENLLINSSVTYRLKIIKENNIRYWDNSYGLEDYVFLTAVSKVGNITNLKEVSLYYRMHPGNTLKKIVDTQMDKRLKVWKDYFRFAYETDGFVLSDDDYSVILNTFTEIRGGRALSNKEYGELLLVFDKIINQAKEMNLDYLNELIQRTNELRIKFSRVEEPQIHNNVPFDENEIVQFCKYHKKIYVYGFGKYGLAVGHIVNYNGFEVEKFVVSNKSSDDDRIIEFDELNLDKTDGLILALGKRNLSEVIERVEKACDRTQILKPQY